MYLTCILHVFRMYLDVTVHIHQDTSRYPVHLYLFSVTLTIIGNVTRGLVAAVDHVAAMAMPIAGLECGETEKVAHRRTARSLVGGPFRADIHSSISRVTTHLVQGFWFTSICGAGIQPRY